MRYAFTNEGRKFLVDKIIEIASNKEQNDTRWQELVKTASGNYVSMFVSLWSGENNTYVETTKDEAIELMEHWGYSVEQITEEFPDYEPTETY